MTDSGTRESAHPSQSTCEMDQLSSAPAKEHICTDLWRLRSHGKKMRMGHNYFVSPVSIVGEKAGEDVVLRHGCVYRGSRGHQEKVEAALSCFVVSRMNF